MGIVALVYLDNLLDRKDSLWVGFPFMDRRVNETSALDGVVGVLLMRPHFEMIRIDTGRNVTLVAHYESFRDWSVGSHIGHPMGVFMTLLAVPAFVDQPVSQDARAQKSSSASGISSPA